ncbi:hypothetical protein [Alkalibacillus almallahensis]|uniref:hypothetical protein n=1 Tax=Alkalibacillus almallahensis TaxID=1379154 RepID=UPI001421FB54|nr:hypothetical protein [Alkalibacillus almallahensis]NIK12550.1 hypothetical protein [Alkalibacillus almallahensis]
MGVGFIGFISIIVFILCFSYTLHFIESLQKGDERIAKQSKKVAIISLSLALVIPFVYSLIVF